MPLSWETLLAAGTAYGLGSVPFGYMIYRFRERRDIRDTGSGNIGATNVLRTVGAAAALATLLLDAAKGYLAVVLAARVTDSSTTAQSLAAFLVIVGHVFPVFLKFRGGKGVAAGLGAFLAIAPSAVFICLVVFVAVAAAWRYVSLASITAAAAFPLILAARGESEIGTLTAALLGAALIIARHWSNIQRLRLGTESPIILRKGSSSD